VSVMHFLTFYHADISRCIVGHKRRGSSGDRRFLRWGEECCRI